MQKLRKAVLWWCFRRLCRGIAALGRLLYDLEAQGLEHLPARGPLMVVPRRISRVDFIAGALLFAGMQEVSGLTGALSILNSRLIAWIGRGLGILPAVKGKGMSTASMLEAYRLLQAGGIIANADEGEVPWDGRLQPLRSGAAWLALRTHAPLIVIVVLGGYDIWPRWARWPHLRGKLILRVGKPFYLCEAPCHRVTNDMLQAANQRLIEEIEMLSGGYLLRTRRLA